MALKVSLHNKKVVVVGAGGSGLAAARLAVKAGARVTINDLARKDPADMPAGVETHFGGHPDELFRTADLIVLSPGVPPLAPVARAEEAGVEVVAEVELALRFLDAGIGAVTGTNGKSTTVSLLGELLAATGRPAFSGGNLGIPLSDVVDTPAGGADGLIALELSSFQLEHITSLRAKVAALLNLTEDHLDRYDSFEHYCRTKLNIFQNGPQAVVYNADDPLVVAGVADVTAPRHGFSVLGTAAAFHLDDGELVFSDWGLRFPTRDMKLTGRHMMANALAAVGSALLMGVEPGLVGPVLADFGGLPHRMSYCGEVRGVRYYDDSKATNVGSVEGSLAGWESPYVLLLGGRHKGAPYTPLIPVLKKRCRAVVVLGESAALIRADLEKDLPVHDAASFDDAVHLAAALARPGDAVILSPACSSYDMFDNYKQRGARFAELVRQLTVGS